MLSIDLPLYVSYAHNQKMNRTFETEMGTYLITSFTKRDKFAKNKNFGAIKCLFFALFVHFFVSFVITVIIHIA